MDVADAAEAIRSLSPARGKVFLPVIVPSVRREPLAPVSRKTQWSPTLTELAARFKNGPLARDTRSRAQSRQRFHARTWRVTARAPSGERMRKEAAPSRASKAVRRVSLPTQNPLLRSRSEPSDASFSTVTVASITSLYKSAAARGWRGGGAAGAVAAEGDPVITKLWEPANSPSMRASRFHSPEGALSLSSMVQ